jgi:hypothetical protein
MLKYEIVRRKTYIEFLRHDILHRIDGHAIIWDDGGAQFWLYGK